MAIKKIITYPNPILTKNSSKIGDFREYDINRIITDLKETMLHYNGIGIAAPQIGMSLRIFLVHTKDGFKEFINPRIIIRSLKKNISEEGCLSIPKVFGLVKRSNKITIMAYTQHNEKFKLSATGLFARVIQHEMNHLECILFIDKATKITQGSDELKRYKLFNKKS